ncbi:MAG: hypothetical protein RLZZ373_2259 [Pseudomonadota bacterium]
MIVEVVPDATSRLEWPLASRLGRPRRFGKSLLVDTFNKLFEGNRALFEDLLAETRWD